MSRKVTIRLGDDDFERLQKRCQETALDISFLIREALSKYLANGGTATQEAKPVGAGLVMPAEAFALTGPYRAWSGDLRAELRRRLLDMLALAYSAADQYPRTKGVREVYLAVLDAYHHLNGVGHGR